MSFEKHKIVNVQVSPGTKRGMCSATGRREERWKSAQAQGRTLGGLSIEPVSSTLNHLLLVQPPAQRHRGAVIITPFRRMRETMFGVVTQLNVNPDSLNSR